MAADIALEMPDLVDYLERELRKLSESDCREQPHASNISMVSPKFRSHFVDAYDPKFISIGPLHFGKAHLMPMQQRLKLRYLQDFLSRGIDSLVRNCVEAVDQWVEEARACYPEVVKSSLTSYQLVSILVLDGCFLIEYMIKFKYRELTGTDYLLRDDLLLLENQIPFFVLEALFQVNFIECTDMEYSLLDVALDFAHGTSVMERRQELIAGETPCHLLHLYHLYHAIPPARLFLERRGYDAAKPQKSFPCALELLELGIVLKERKRATLFSVSLKKDVLRIPPLAIDHGTISHFLNVVAWEQQQQSGELRKTSTEHIFTDYAVLMSYVMRTNSDLELLEKIGILQRDPSVTREKVIEVFSKIREVVSFDYGNHLFADLFWSVSDLRNSRWRMRKAKAIRDLRKVLPGFMENPFVMVPLLVAAIYLGLTGIQTFVTVLNYIRPRSPN